MASCSTEPSTGSAWIQEEDEEEKEPKSPQKSSSDDSESEPEPPLASVVRRKVSFADAFGLDLVSVKEFDNRVQSAEAREREEFYLSCIFSVPASDDELEFRLRQNKLELERIELLPGSTNIRGIVRVLNLSYHKVVYVRTTLDGWQSHFDQLAEYVPGSSDGETDRFSFQLTMMPPFPPEGLRVEFCLYYESNTGIFWANNGGMNYVLFCHQRRGRTVREKEEDKEKESEENNQKGKKSCLKTIIKWSCAESNPTDMSSDLSEQETSRFVANKKEKTQQEAANRSKHLLEESCKTLAERRNRQQASQQAFLQDYFSYRDAEVQLVQPSHTEISKTDFNVVLPIPQSSIPVMTDISSTLQECKILPDHQNLLPPVDWGRNISSPSDTNTLEIISGTRMDVPEKEKTEDVSKKLSNDAWKNSLNGTENLDNQKHNNALDQKCLLCTVGSNSSQPSNTEYDVSNIGDKILSVWNTNDCAVSTENGSCQCFRAMESLESDPAKLSPTAGPSHISDVLNNKYPAMGQNIFEPNTVQESESVWVQCRPGGTEALHDRHLLSERSSSKDEAMLLPEQGETPYANDATEQLNSKPGHKVFFEEGTSCTVFVDMKITHTVIKDTLTLTRIGNKPFIEGRESLERQQLDDIGEPMKKKEHIEEGNENGSHKKRMSLSEYSDKALVVQENQLQEVDEEPSHWKDGNTEILISLGTSIICDKAEPHKQAEYPDKIEDVAVCYGLVKEELSNSSEKQREILSVENRECKNCLKTEDQVTYVTQSKREEDTDKELHKFQNSPETCLHPSNLCTGTHTSSPSEHFTCTASLSEGELLFPAPYKGFKSEETLRYRVTQDLQDQGVGTEFPNSFSRTASPSASTLSSWLLICWAKISNLSPITGAIVCAILFVIFVTAYLYDLPVCLAIYLLSACWWCRQGVKKDVTTADSLD